MTRIIYENVPILLETNRDCSTITLNFLDSDIELVRELREKLRLQGFSIWRKFINDNQLRLSAPSSNTKETLETILMVLHVNAQRGKVNGLNSNFVGVYQAAIRDIGELMGIDMIKLLKTLGED